MASLPAQLLAQSSSKACRPRTANPESPFSLLVDELALYIFSFLNPEEINTAALVCRDWLRLARDESIWRAFCERQEWRIARANTRGDLITSWRESFISSKPPPFIYTQRLWLEDVCSIATLVVLGTAQHAAAVKKKTPYANLFVEKVLHGSLPDGAPPVLRLHPPYRIEIGRLGVWFLLYTETGLSLCINPYDCLNVRVYSLDEWNFHIKPFFEACRRRRQAEGGFIPQQPLVETPSGWWVCRESGEPRRPKMPPTFRGRAAQGDTGVFMRYDSGERISDDFNEVPLCEVTVVEEGNEIISWRFHGTLGHLLQLFRSKPHPTTWVRDLFARYAKQPASERIGRWMSFSDFEAALYEWATQRRRGREEAAGVFFQFNESTGRAERYAVFRNGKLAGTWRAYTEDTDGALILSPDDEMRSPREG